MSKLHRVSSSEKLNTSGDVVFVHGLGGNNVDTWSAKGAQDAFWPAWLDAALPSVLVHSAEYEASPSSWLGGAMPMSDRALNLLALLHAERIGLRPLVFVTHSLGGLLVKQLLRNADGFGTAAWKQIAAHTRGVVFLATPHQGSHLADYVGALRHIFGLTGLVKELEANASTLRELNLWYRENVGRLGIRTQVFFETRETHGVRVVDESSSDPGVTGAIPTPIDADHLEICKPIDHDALVYKMVTSFISDSLALPPPNIAGPPNASAIYRRTFDELASLADVLNALDDLFEFRWERSSYDMSHTNPLVYWPVRLRHPTPIHAAQCFAAAGLQQRGAEIHLFIDDLGKQDFSIDVFINKFQAWFTMIGGALTDLSITKFSDVIPPVADGSLDTALPWPTVRKWLGDTEYRMDLILRLAKLVPLSDPTSFDELAEKRPRRLLTPALVWSCLQYLHAKIPTRPLLTLGGYDERPLWEAWRDRAISPTALVGHLYAPQLSEVDNQHGSIPLHMARPTKFSIEWNSKDDIRTALQNEFGSGGNWYDSGRLVPWCAKCCVFLPRFFKGQELRLPVASGEITLTAPMESITPAHLSPFLVDELATWLI